MNFKQLCPSFRRTTAWMQEVERCRKPKPRPESSGFNDFLDAGLRRHDDCGVSGTAMGQSRLIEGVIILDRNQ